MNQLTTSPVVVSGNSGGPEFVNSTVARKLFSICKTHLYDLLAEGKIRSVCLRRRGAVRGKRLWDVSSIRDYLTSNMEGIGL
jgi:hypothetical protein